jgi:hypothetical protein
MGEKRNAHRIMVSKPSRRPRRSWGDNIKMNIREIGWGGLDCINLAQDRDQWRALVNTAMKLGVPSNVGKFLSSLAALLLEKDGIV